MRLKKLGPVRTETHCGKTRTGILESVWQLGLDMTGILRAGGPAMPTFWEYNPEQA
jgi:hypothetical protein